MRNRLVLSAISCLALAAAWPNVGARVEEASPLCATAEVAGTLTGPPRTGPLLCPDRPDDPDGSYSQRTSPASQTGRRPSPVTSRAVTLIVPAGLAIAMVPRNPTPRAKGVFAMDT